MANDHNPQMEEQLKALVDITDALLRGDFKENPPEIDAEGLLSVLARQINTMLLNMRTMQAPLANAGEQAPFLVGNARDVVELMEQATGEVLDKADRVIVQAEQLEQRLNGADQQEQADNKSLLTEMKAAVYDIIASQSYQDVARQRMEKQIADLNQVRDWLIEVLVVLNLKKDSSAANIEKKKELLREVYNDNTPSSLKQDLVDELLSEYGF
ncbi:hypothetical protein [Desulfurivibrio alkaliphilus]|uniref:Chemotaxis protein CheZ n=1 Tax=Desulfurivibrio alkaliphilus (strain DSM 19089 / UNIQEM U267 / AHT2) TaxID=589865 RepID=D6Z413_DESAT|nr:hypothetical protein [Desulfurivibrio alkaliphilus]ADH86288.1 hypothetical protein DaAHT2_1593 [Desulfurivibrio alkaliphilus AHT 2]